MQQIVVRSEADAWRLWNDFTAGRSVSNLRFAGWPRLSMEASTPFDGVRIAKAVLALQGAVESQYCLLKYGKINRSHLTAEDRARIGLDVSYEHGNRRVVIDMTNAANAAVQAIDDWDADGPRQANLFAEENWPRTVREVGLALVDKVRPRDLKSIAIAGVVVAGLAYCSPIMWKEGLSHLLASQEPANQHVLKLAELERTTILSKNVLPASTVRLVEDSMTYDSRQAARLISDRIEHPLVKFVVATAERTRPDLLSAAPEEGTVAINGLSLTGASARAISKLARKDRNSAPPAWTTTIRKAAAIDS